MLIQFVRSLMATLLNIPPKYYILFYFGISLLFILSGVNQIIDIWPQVFSQEESTIRIW